MGACTRCPKLTGAAAPVAPALTRALLLPDSLVVHRELYYGLFRVGPAHWGTLFSHDPKEATWLPPAK